MRDAPNFIVLHRRCPICGSPLIRNRRGIECGELHCEYSDDSTIERLTAQVATLVEALRFYANENAWDGDHPDSFDLAGDVGDLARAALKAAGVEP